MSEPLLSTVLVPLPSYSTSSVKGKALLGKLAALIANKGLSRSPLHLPPFYSLLFVTQKASGSWRPVIDLSSLNGFVQFALFRMESSQLFLQSIRNFDWLISIDLKDTYLLVPFHPSSRQFLRFVASVSPRPLKCSQGSCLRCHLSSQPGRSVVALFG